MKDYPIKRTIDETTCDQCGAPLLLGALAVQRDDDLAQRSIAPKRAPTSAPDCWSRESASVSTWSAPRSRPSGALPMK